MLKNGLILFSFLIVFLPIFSQIENARNYTSQKIREQISLDGELNEQIWKTGNKIKDFIQNFPTDTLLAKSNTEAILVYDTKGIYVALICFDTLKGKKIVQSLKRDFSVTKNDAIVVTLSPLNDKNTGFSFGVNAEGAQREGLISTGGIGGVSTSWDNKWFSATKQYADKWITEMFIPFKTLRYKNGSTEWGLNIARFDYKRNETSNWNRVPRGLNVSHLGFAGTLHFEEPLVKTGSNISVIPFVLGGVNYNYDRTGTSIKNLASIGGDVKFGVTSSLNLDLTFNPDFAQVEVDDQVVNLDRFELFFPERRQFFLENADMFDQFGFSRIRPFFSRRVGLNNGKIIPIAVGARLSGNIDKNWRVGLMNIQTLKSEEAKTAPQNFTVAAFTRRVLNRSFVGLIATHKQNIASKDKSFNSLLGSDFNFLSKNNFWRGRIFYHHTFTNALLSDAGATAMWLMYRTSKWNIQWNHEYIGKNYIAEMGFVPRKGVFRLEPSISRTFFAKKRKVFSHTIGFYNNSYYSPYHRFLSIDQLNNFHYDITFLNTSLLSFNFNEIQTRLQTKFDPTQIGNALHEIGNYHYRNGSVSFTSDFRKAFNFNIRVLGGSFFSGHRLNYSTTFFYRVQPYVSFSLNIERNELFFRKPFKNAHLTLLNFKSEVSFTKDIFFNTIVQYNTQSKAFGTNIRLQWRFKPMSDLYIVYTDNYTDQFIPRSRAFAIKLNYWISL
jgi:hypothetical protein